MHTALQVAWMVIEVLHWQVLLSRKICHRADFLSTRSLIAALPAAKVSNGQA